MRRVTLCGMRRIFLLVLFPLAVGGAELRIDHITVAGARLDTMRQAFSLATRIGTEYGGKHSNHASEMALASFPDGSYLELIGIQPDADPAAVASHVWSAFLRGNAGPCAFAIRVPDVAAEIARFTSVGVQAGEIEKSGRVRPDGVELSWETAEAGPGPRGSVLPFLIRDFSPREKRAYPTGKPTTTRYAGVALAVIGVRDLNGAVALYRKAYGLPEPKRQRDAAFGADLAWFEGTPVALAAPVGPDSWLAGRIGQFGNSPCAFLLASTARTLRRSGTRWFGRPVEWFDERKLGWKLGVWG